MNGRQVDGKERREWVMQFSSVQKRERLKRRKLTHLSEPSGVVLHTEATVSRRLERPEKTCTASPEWLGSRGVIERSAF